MDKSVILILTILSPFINCIPQEAYLKIYNGDLANPNEYPYVVALINVIEIAWIKKMTRMCTGSVIQKTFILTAANCFKTLPPTFIQYGNMTVPPEESETKSKILKIIKHPKYDIGLILTEPINITTMGTPAKVSYNTLLNQELKFVGYGRHRAEQYIDSPPLRIGKGIVGHCPKETSEEVKNNLICLWPLSNVQHSLSEDSGGPLLYQEGIVGVMSQGHQSKNTNLTIFTPIAEYKNWIHQNILDSEIKTK